METLKLFGVIVVILVFATVAAIGLTYVLETFGLVYFIVGFLLLTLALCYIIPKIDRRGMKNIE